MVEDIFRKTIEKYALLKKKDKLILGVSGGPDSLCMLHLFTHLKDDYKLELLCAHFNHSLREEADEEEVFVHKTCAALGIRFISDKKDVKKFFKGDSLEQTARNLRYDFFLQCARRFKFKKLALAHHKDDLVETVLMRLIRGSGLRGLRGFLPQSKFKGLTVIRPLIELRKQDILDWLGEKKIHYCIDKTNLEEKFLRNKIRLKVLPLLNELNPNITENLYNIACSISLDYDFIYDISYRHFESLKKGLTNQCIKLDLEGLRKLPQAILNNVLRIAIEEIKGDTRRIEIRHLGEVCDLIFIRPVGSIVDLPSLLVKKEEKLLRVQAH